MPDRPPSPSPSSGIPTPTVPSATDASRDDRVVTTTSHLATTIEDVVGTSVDEAVLEDLLLEFDRCGYLEWVAVTATGEYVWDLTDSADRIADAVAELVAERVYSWLDGHAATDTNSNA